VALKNLETLDSLGLVPRVKDVIGPYMARRLHEAFDDHPLVGEVRTLGLLGAIELVADRKNRTFFPDPGTVGTQCRNYCFGSGLVSRAIRDTMVLSPPLIINESEIDEIVAKLKDAVDRTARDFGRL
jgi:putrescine aminotransferase